MLPDTALAFTCSEPFPSVSCPPAAWPAAQLLAVDHDLAARRVGLDRVAVVGRGR